MVVGCAEVVETSDAEQEIGGACPPWGCLNSPEVNYLGMHEMHLLGEKNLQGMSFESSPETKRPYMFFNGNKYELYIEKNRFVAIANGIKRRGSQLVGGELRVVKDGAGLYNIRIQHVRQTLFPVGDKEEIELYELEWISPSATSTIGKPLCNGGVLMDESDLLGMRREETLIFVGDRIDAGALTIDREPSNTWVNFGCAGLTLAKLHLTRNTTSARSRSPKGNQATLKMLTADYCGKGRPVTVSGTPLKWQGGLMTYPAAPGALEARWTERGATCVNALRLTTTPSPMFPNPWATILQDCSPPSCANTNPYDMDGALRVSALPW